MSETVTPRTPEGWKVSGNTHALVSMSETVCLDATASRLYRASPPEMSIFRSRNPADTPPDSAMTRKQEEESTTRLDGFSVPTALHGVGSVIGSPGLRPLRRGLDGHGGERREDLLGIPRCGESGGLEKQAVQDLAARGLEGGADGHPRHQQLLRVAAEERARLRGHVAKEVRGRRGAGPGCGAGCSTAGACGGGVSGRGSGLLPRGHPARKSTRAATASEERARHFHREPPGARGSQMKNDTPAGAPGSHHALPPWRSAIFDTRYRPRPAPSLDWTSRENL